MVECWDDVIRTTASLEARTVAPSVLLKMLASYRRQNRLDLAIAEIGRIERALFTLDWLKDTDARRRYRVGLNTDETRHFLAQTICVLRQGSISVRAPRGLGNAEQEC